MLLLETFQTNYANNKKKATNWKITTSSILQRCGENWGELFTKQIQ